MSSSTPPHPRSPPHTSQIRQPRSEVAHSTHRHSRSQDRTTCRPSHYPQNLCAEIPTWAIPSQKLPPPLPYLHQQDLTTTRRDSIPSAEISSHEISPARLSFLEIRSGDPTRSKVRRALSSSPAKDGWDDSKRNEFRRFLTEYQASYRAKNTALQSSVVVIDPESETQNDLGSQQGHDVQVQDLPPSQRMRGDSENNISPPNSLAPNPHLVKESTSAQSNQETDRQPIAFLFQQIMPQQASTTMELTSTTFGVFDDEDEMGHNRTQSPILETQAPQDPDPGQPSTLAVTGLNIDVEQALGFVRNLVVGVANIHGSEVEATPEAPKQMEQQEQAALIPSSKLSDLSEDLQQSLKRSWVAVLSRTQGDLGSTSERRAIAEAEAKATVLCSVCFSDVPVSQSYPLQQCQHIFCLECLVAYIESRMDQNQLMNIPCPDPSCTAMLQVHEIRAIISEESFQRYEKLLFLEAMRMDPDACWCPKGCPFVVIGDPSMPRIRCTVCNLSICIFCKTEWHAPLTCSEARTSREQGDGVENKIWMLQNSKQCPACRSPIQKNGGCNHMTCASCKKEFCWLCLSVIVGTSHFRTGKCRQFSS